MIIAGTGSVTSNPTCPISKHLNNPPRFLSKMAKSSKSNRFSDNRTYLKLCSCECYDLYKELVPYKEAWSWQKSIVKEKKALIERNEGVPDSLIILQHHPVYTMGTASSLEFLNFNLNDAPYEVFRTERGGEVTYHGPGQLVMYPIINLRNHKMDLHWYLRALEEVIIRVLSNTFSIKASRLEGFTGVWVGNQKLAAIGIRVAHWITYHGLALNVANDLTPFQSIVPCGIRDRQVGSIKGLLAEMHHVSDMQLIDIAHESLIQEFSEVFQLRIHHKSIPKDMSSVAQLTHRGIIWIQTHHDLLDEKSVVRVGMANSFHCELQIS